VFPHVVDITTFHLYVGAFSQIIVTFLYDQYIKSNSICLK